MDGPAPPQPEEFLDTIVEFNKGTSYERLQPITDYRPDPGEARILYICRQTQGGRNRSQDSDDEEFVMKIKIQVPPRPASTDPTAPLSGPSETTEAELKALQTFRQSGLEGVPHLIDTKCTPQGPDGPFPGGYISYTVMTKMPGLDLMASKFWSLADEEKDERREAFLLVLKSIWRLGIAPYDCALRNVLWDPEQRKCSIVDFEHYDPAKDPINMHQKEEMQRWGLVQRPPPSHWAIEWGLIKEPGGA
ncbi:hypothetical protein LTR85_002102 [Meristemomyces frigidus]|nr:hypothetical protein LTR85_002102 [Meristemomyces frigidus]